MRRGNKVFRNMNASSDDTLKKKEGLVVRSDFVCLLLFFVPFLAGRHDIGPGNPAFWPWLVC